MMIYIFPPSGSIIGILWHSVYPCIGWRDGWTERGKKQGYRECYVSARKSIRNKMNYTYTYDGGGWRRWSQNDKDKDWAENGEFHWNGGSGKSNTCFGNKV